jgi:D-alanyl-D-alanine carboxypeptidase
VTVSAAAAQVGGSQTGFSEGEIQTLRTLLYSLMVDSGNDAAVAIAEHVGEAAGGDMDTFIDRMNQKADDLNMDDTTYCQPAGGCFSTPADQVALWLSVYDDPLFQQFVGPVSYIGCGEDAQGNEVCHSFTRSTSSYPGHDGRKGGSRGFYCDDDFERPSNGGPPLCASGGCTTEQTTRLGRTLIANNLHPLPLSANRWTDTQNMFDYGYRQRFTPDARSAGVNASETANFSLTTLDDTLAVVATIEGQRVRLCSWNAYATSGQLNQLGCAERPINGLVAGDVQPQVQQVQIVGGSTIEADGDFLVGYRDGNSLVLRLWRIGAKDF